MNFREKYPSILFCIYIIIWAGLAIKPNYRSVWIDENILTVLFVGLLVFSYVKGFRFSNTSYSLIFVFMVLHSIGGHYSYTEIPLFDILKDKFDWSRNHYDRVVHFSFGFLFLLPIYELLIKFFSVRKGGKGILLAFLVVAALKGIFELIEYGYVWVRADELNLLNYLGEQGDAWDSQKDVALGVLGGIISCLIVSFKGLFRKK